MAWKWLWNTKTKYYDEEITKETDWGGDESTGGLAVSGGRVQAWLKNEINGKFGYARIPVEVNESNFLTLELFANKEDADKYDEAEDKEAEGIKDLVMKVVIPISTVQGDSYSAFLLTDIPAKDIVVANGVLKAKFNYRSIKYTQGQAFNENAAGTLIVQRSTDNSSTYNEVGRITNVLVSREPNDNTTFEDEIDLGSYLTTGNQRIRVRASFDYEDPASGETKTQYSSWVNIGTSVNKTNLELKLLTSYHTPMRPVDTNGNAANFSVSYQTSGSVNKVLYLEITGSAGTNKISRTLTPSDSQYVVSLSDASYLTHGVKKVKAWMECEDGLGNTLKSNVLVNRFMMAADEADENPYLLLQNIEAGEGIENFVQTEIAEYAVYQKGDADVKVTFLLTSYAQDNASWTTEYFRMDAVVKPRTENKLLTTVEIEAVNDAEAQDVYTTYFRVRRTDASGVSDFMQTSTNETSYKVDVDNTNGMTPVTGATFLLNPKVRNNNEEHPDRIYNAKDGNKVVDAEFVNFGFINDGWMTDSEGNKVLRVMAGSTLEIKRDIWAQFRKTPASSLTFEIDCKISNVTNTTDPILQVFSGTKDSFRGLKMNALEGWLMNATEQSKDDCLFAWQEDVRTHFSINLNHQVFPNKGDVQYTDATNANGSIALARVLINGDCQRELKYDISNPQEWTTSESGSIIIGNEGADIDIYSIRIYEDKKLEMTDILKRNYLSTLPISEQKLALKNRNDLLNDSGLIDVEAVKRKGKNCLVWHGALPYKMVSSSQKGWFEVFRYDADGNYLPEYSGTLCKETKSLSIKGQGTTAKTYYDWNIQDDMSKVTATIQVALKDFHESIHVRIDGDQAFIYGGNLGKNAPIETEENEQAYPYANGYVTVPDGWVDGNGKYRGMGYRVAENTSLAQKKVLKINYASSMQSHLIGACNTYDELHRKIVGDTPIQKIIPTAVSAKRTEPFMFFSQDNASSKTYFRGMGNYGAGKADKVTWGYIKKQMPLFALIEGSDNNPVMTNFLVPFDKNTAKPHYDEDGEFDGWEYNGAISWDYDLGATGDDGLPTQAIFDKWADFHNFVYLHSTNIKFFDGAFDVFQRSEEASKNTSYKYWCTQGAEAYNLKRYDFLSGQWVNAGLSLYRNNYVYYAINLSTAQETEKAYAQWTVDGNGDYARLNELFKQSYTSHMRKYLKYFVNEKSLLFNYSYVLQFLAGTDNSAKNTYYKIDPIGVPMDTDNTFKSWFGGRFGYDFDFSSVHQVFFDGDDMDSIFRTDNNAHQTKPYYIERMYPCADEKPNVSLYEGMNNQLFNFVERAYAADGTLADMMRQILNAAQNLVVESDRMDASIKTKISAWGFLNKYFFEVQRYFPEIAYLEQARIRYEFPELIGYVSSGAGTRSISPITQSLGSQLQNEMQYMSQRLVYFASYASFGEFGSAGAYSLGLDDAKDTFGYEAAYMPDGSPSVHTYTVKSHQYIYPCYFDGSTFHNTGYRLSPNDPNGCTFTITENGGGDVGIGICGINYLTDLGKLNDKSVEKSITINGKRLTRVQHDWDSSVFRPSDMTIKATNVNMVFLPNTTRFQSLDLSRLVRMKSCTSCAIETIYPESSNLTLIYLNGNEEVLSLNNVPNLEEIQIIGHIDLMRKIHIGASVGDKTDFSIQPVVQRVYDINLSVGRRLQYLYAENINWTDLNVEVLSWLADLPTCELKGTISIKEDHPQGQPRVTWDLKNKFISKFGNVDEINRTESKGLLLKYKRRYADYSQFKIKGNFYVESTKDVDFQVVPDSIYSNNQRWVLWNITKRPVKSEVSINYLTGRMTVGNLSDTYDSCEVSANVFGYKDDNNNISDTIISKTIEIWNRPAQVGDLVYADGTFSSAASWDEEKTPIGICFHVGQDDGTGTYTNPNDTQKRLMVALEDVVIPVDGVSESSLQWGIMPTIDSNSDAWNEQYALYDKNASNARVLLTSESSKVSNMYDIQTIQNIGSSGLTNSCIDPNPTTNPNGASDYRSNEDEALMYNNGFKLLTPDTASGDGFSYRENETLYKAYLTARTLDEDLASLAGSGYKKGDIVNSAYAKTLKVIQHRNRILQSNIMGADANNPLIASERFQIPRASSGKSELESLGDTISAIRAWAKDPEKGLGDVYPNKWSQLCYPFVSACYAYQPEFKLKSGEVLADKFKAHNWFAPTQGLITRICWLVRYGESGGYDPFANAKQEGLLKFSSSSYHWSVTELTSLYAWYVTFTNGYTTSNGKYHSLVGRAVSAF